MSCRRSLRALRRRLVSLVPVGGCAAGRLGLRPLLLRRWLLLLLLLHLLRLLRLLLLLLPPRSSVAVGLGLQWLLLLLLLLLLLEAAAAAG